MICRVRISGLYKSHITNRGSKTMEKTIGNDSLTPDAFGSAFLLDVPAIEPSLVADISFMDFCNLLHSLESNKNDGHLVVEIVGDSRNWFGAISGGKLKAANFVDEKSHLNNLNGIPAVKELLKAIYISKVQPQGKVSFYLGDFDKETLVNIPKPIGQLELIQILNDLETVN